MTDDTFEKWAREKMTFPEDFIAEAMQDDETKNLREEAKTIKTEFTLEEFGMAAARAIALFKRVSDFAGVEINVDSYIRVTAMIAAELFEEKGEDE